MKLFALLHGALDGAGFLGLAFAIVGTEVLVLVHDGIG